MTKKISFNHNDSWCTCFFYKIYMKDNIKMIKFIGKTDRESRGKDYLSWVCVYCEEKCEMPLKDFLLWDVYYQLNTLMNTCDNNLEVEVEPLECFEQSNEWLRNDGSGSYFLKLLDLTENTPCDYYYGY